MLRQKSHWPWINNGNSPPEALAANPQRRIRITENETRKLPQNAHQIRVFAGGAWVSSLHTNNVLHQGQSLTLGRKHEDVVVTAAGRQPLVLEIIS